MANNVSVKFQVSGTELSQYISEIQSKSDKLTATAISGAIEQTKKGKEQLQIIEQQITALEKKKNLELEAARAVLIGKRNTGLEANKDYFEGRKNDVFADTKLSDSEKKEKIIALEGSERAGSERIKGDYREELTNIKETSRQTKLQTQLSRETIETLKLTAKENVKAIMSGDMKLADVMKDANSDEERLIAKLTEDGVLNEKKLQAKEGGKGGIFTGMLGVDNINKFISAAGQLAQTQNGFDLIQPTSNMAGRIIGGILGAVVGSFVTPGVGTVAGAAGGASIGGMFGDTFGAYMQREAMTKQDFFKSAYRYNAITGSDASAMFDMQNSGVSATDFMNMRSDIARRRGYAGDSDKTTRDSIYLDKGYGVDQGTSGSIIELQRSAREGNRDLANFVGSILQKGNGNIFKNGDQSYLNEFLGKFIAVQKDLLKTQTVVATGTTMDILSKFNLVGGEFASRDSRSSGNISAIQNGLSNPGSDNLKALSFAILRKTMPNASIFDILSERQKGLGSSTYLKGMLGAVENLGGDESQQMLNLSGMFSGLSYAAVKTLYKNRKGLMSGNISMDELRLQNPEDFQGKSEANTTLMDRNTAMVTNGILGGEGVEKMVDAFTSALKESLGGAVITLNNGQGTITLPSRGQVIKNTVQSQKVKKIVDHAMNMQAASTGNVLPLIIEQFQK